MGVFKLKVNIGKAFDRGGDESFKKQKPSLLCLTGKIPRQSSGSVKRGGMSSAATFGQSFRLTSPTALRFCLMQ